MHLTSASSEAEASLDERRGSLRTLLSAQPRCAISLLPTPLQELPRFSAALGGPRILMKRDDMTGLAYGGNKARVLDYFIGEAVAQGCDVLIGGGAAIQSNHAMMCAAAARKAGLEPVILARQGTKYYAFQGNYLLTKILVDGGVVLYSERPTDHRKRIGSRRLEVMNLVADELRAQGRKPYVLAGTTQPTGALGYVEACLELHGQCTERGVEPDWIFLTSTGAGQAGLLLGAACLEWSVKVVGCAPSPGASDEERAHRVADLANATAELLGTDERVDPATVTNLGYGGEGYGVVTRAGMEAQKLLARTEGIFLDPVYTSKGVSGLIDQIRLGRISPKDTVVYVHTGGGPLNFAYASELVSEFGLCHEDDRVVED